MRQGSIKIDDFSTEVLLLAEFLGIERLLLAIKVRWYCNIGKGPVHTTDDEIGFMTQYCKDNNYFNRKGTEEEKLRECIDGELRYTGLAWMLGGFMFYFSLIIIPLFLIYFYFYYKWLRKNYFKKV